MYRLRKKKKKILSISLFVGEEEIKESLLLGGSNKGERKRWFHRCSVSTITKKWLVMAERVINELIASFCYLYISYSTVRL